MQSRKRQLQKFLPIEVSSAAAWSRRSSRQSILVFFELLTMLLQARQRPPLVLKSASEVSCAVTVPDIRGSLFLVLVLPTLTGAILHEYCA